jgi:hypothetical protein
VFIPLDHENSEKILHLFGQINLKYGGRGFEEFYRIPNNVSTLEERLRNTNPGLTKDYDPGWAYQPSSKTNTYAQVFSDAREQRLWQLSNIASKLQNDEYYETYQALAELEKDRPTFHSGSSAFDEQARLAARLQEIAKTIPELPHPKMTSPQPRVDELMPDLAKLQVASGFNGPAIRYTFIFKSEDEVRNSWLARALSDQDLKTAIAKTDFSTQNMVAFSLGKITNASGQIEISQLSHDHHLRGYTIGVILGVVPDSCGASPTESYPFVVGVTEAIAGARVAGNGTIEAPSKCGPIVSGKPSPFH